MASAIYTPSLFELMAEELGALLSLALPVTGSAPTRVERSMADAPSSRRAQVADLYQKYGHLVRTRCYFLLRDEEAARDAAQEVFVRVMRSIESFREDASPSTWMLKIATNHCLNVIASQKAKWRDRFQQYMTHLDEEGLLAGADPEKARLVAQLLAKLDRETQQVAIFYFVDEMTQEEIAQATGRSLPTVRKRLAKFKRVAQKELGHDVP
jgi:RNA polymerase sigma-70 factor (ECF subfamily)